eukprot:CAMPEP_0171482632 /NCGR_PEP_ID=MMETSP0946-20130122/7615_1 /TAXON_ID=109269 /ORGANISM="Vaucheria litorea, Strain CCMP2940" /LENGTH=471 /DNA_ID=CAMNT_0012014749 /DNA_START=122 /DNA_END=1533 /DNA_ORIENTATION=+
MSSRTFHSCDATQKCDSTKDDESEAVPSSATAENRNRKLKARIDLAKNSDGNGEQFDDYDSAINNRSRKVIAGRLRDADRKDEKIKVLFLISDTGGGHRASAQALDSAFNILYPNRIKIEVIDILTEHSNWPMNSSVSAYQYAAKNPIVWRIMYEIARFPLSRHLSNEIMGLQNCGMFIDAFEKHAPDFVVSIHPLTQNLPLKALRAMSSDRDKKREVPFVTIVTDLGSAHPTWFDKSVDKVFVPSESVMNVAFSVGVHGNKIKNFGLPIRPEFWSDPKPKDQLRKELNMKINAPAVMVVGGGDGVGGLRNIAIGIIERLSDAAIEGHHMQIIVVCGKNAALREELMAMKVYQGLSLQILGFVKNMDMWMGAVDVIVTKAGPGTIAEAAIRGLPIMLSGYLPGQEEGNVPLVVNGGYGAFCSKPKDIANTVASWLTDKQLLKRMSENAKRAARQPSATFDIANEIGKMIFE